MRAAVLALLCACAHSELPAVAPDPAVRESLELRTQTDARGGVTSWEVEYAYSLSEEQGACRLRAPRVMLALRQSLPVASANSSPALLAGIDALEKHEEGHLRIDRAAAHELAEALRAIPPMESCEAVRLEAQRTALGVIDACKRRNAAYDAETGHGTR
jgi:predicted secreted Zn-dependent protease